MVTPDKFNGLVQRVLRLLLEESPALIAYQNSLNKMQADCSVESSPAVLTAVQQQKLLLEHIVTLIFLSHCFTNLAEVGVLRKCLRELYSLSVWRDYLQPNRLEAELRNHPRYARLMKKLQRYQTTRLSAEERDELELQHSFLPYFMDIFLSLLNSVPSVNDAKVSFLNNSA